MEIEIITEPEVNSGSVPQKNKTVVGSQDFIKYLFIELNKKDIWRSLTSLSHALHVDSQELSEWLDKNSDIVRRVGKKNTYYCLFDRLSNNKSNQETDYAMAMLHMTYYQFYKIMKTYGLEIGRSDPEAFANFVSSLDKLEMGLILFSKSNKTVIEKLPKFN